MRSTLLFAALVAPCAAFAVMSCSPTPDTTAATTLLTPDFGEFAGSTTDASTDPGVHTYLEKRCGTLDCHGQVGRPFRLFSQDGLRAADAGLISGVQPDTPSEVYSNYLSAVGLQPEEMSQVVAGDAPPTDLLLVQKPTGMVTHKGGTVIAVGDPAYNCLVDWLSSNSPPTSAQRQTDATACVRAVAALTIP
jgi:hypothetical protein